METEQMDPVETSGKPVAWDSESYGWEFHKWPLGIAVAVTLVLYGLIWLFVDPNPMAVDPTQLPPPPGSF